MVSNLLHAWKKETLTAKYDGYSSCPLLVQRPLATKVRPLAKLLMLRRKRVKHSLLIL